MIPSKPVAYILISACAVLFATQFIFQQKYSDKEGTSVSGALRFSLFGAIFQIPLALLMGIGDGLDGFSVKATGVCVLAALDFILNAYFCVKVFESADMTLFSIFEMLGGMALPFVAGMVFFDESVRIWKFVGFALITLALILETGKASPVRGKAIFYYAGLFITNGLSGVLATMNARYVGAGTNAFIILSAAARIVISAAALLFMKYVKKESIAFKNTKTALAAIAPYILISTLGTFCLLTALKTLDASVQYPMSSGGTIVVSAIISTIKKEKLKPRNYIAAAIAVASAVIIAL